MDHLSVIFCALAVRPLGPIVAADPESGCTVVVPARVFGDYLSTMCGLIRRYGASEPTVSLALLRLLDNCAHTLPPDPVRLDAVRAEADLVLADAEAHVANPADVVPVQVAALALHTLLEPS